MVVAKKRKNMFFLKNFFPKIDKKEVIFLLLLLLSGIFFRFFKLEQSLSFLGDEGRDMLIVMDIIRGKNFPLIGPRTSVGKLYLGPIYYYFIAPFAWLFKLNPVGPAVFVALLASVTPVLFYFFLRFFFPFLPSAVAVFLYNFSPVVIKFSRASWNPNPMPFFILFLLFSLFFWTKTKKNKFLFASIIFLGIILQLHYLPIIMVPFLLWYISKNSKTKKDKRNFFYVLLIFFLMISPLFVFDLKHNFVNFKGFLEIVIGRTNEGFDLFDILSRSRDRIRQLFSLFFGFKEREWRNNFMTLLILFFVFLPWRRYSPIFKNLILGWFFWAIISLGFYRESVYEHYLGFLYLWPAILIANFFDNFLKNKSFLKIIFAVFLFLFLAFNSIKKSWIYINVHPSLNVDLVKKIVNLIKKESQGKPFNFALLAKNNYDDSYRFFFVLWNLPVEYKDKVTDQLFVVCEDEDICQPQGNPKWEIALFDASYDGKIELAQSWQPDPFIKVFKFIPKKDAIKIELPRQ